MQGKADWKGGCSVIIRSVYVQCPVKEVLYQTSLPSQLPQSSTQASQARQEQSGLLCTLVLTPAIAPASASTSASSRNRSQHLMERRTVSRSLPSSFLSKDERQIGGNKNDNSNNNDVAINKSGSCRQWPATPNAGSHHRSRAATAARLALTSPLWPYREDRTTVMPHGFHFPCMTDVKGEMTTRSL
ncbi:hypothetical protein CKAH01_05151 [Colletotrichum kahawae]|uniref:Uncharacterized protein n=1 Tax=Colletotrichum kahawae TaxID=34407 RepID=A0AAD9YHB5_COLKA|nr:hypothetical protein CKAH01_05151 [Colletotrichum kahawae]